MKDKDSKLLSEAYKQINEDEISDNQAYQNIVRYLAKHLVGQYFGDGSGIDTPPTYHFFKGAFLVLEMLLNKDEKEIRQDVLSLYEQLKEQEYAKIKQSYNDAGEKYE